MISLYGYIHYFNNICLCFLLLFPHTHTNMLLPNYFYDPVSYFSVEYGSMDQGFPVSAAESS